MRGSPRSRRLANDRLALLRLQRESSIFEFETPEAEGDELPEEYRLSFRGRGLYRSLGELTVRVREWHEVRVRLGASYPRMMPELFWETPIFHPNISSQGVVCLGGFSTHWAPSLQLDRLCELLWDMIRYQNYDISNPYNWEAAHWARNQREYSFPVDPRPLRTPRAAAVGSDPAVARGERGEFPLPEAPEGAAELFDPPPIVAEIVFLDDSPG